MQLGMDDVAVYVYTLAAVFSTIWLVNELGIEGTTPALGFSAALALVWTLYFRWDVAPRLEAESANATDE